MPADITIAADVPTPLLSIRPGFADRLEGTVEIGTQFTFAVTRAGDSTVPVSMRYTVSSRQADEFDFIDERFPSGLLSMAAGETSKSIAILVSSDRLPEADETFTITLSSPVNAAVDPAGASATGIIRNDDAFVTPVYRFAKISNGAYFFTGSQPERDQIVGSFPDFRPEGVGFYAYADASVGAPVYRFANLSNGGYFYTGSLIERNLTIQNFPNMRYEGSTFSVATPDTLGAQPVYRLANLNNGAYLYTTLAAERDFAQSLGFWRYEGVSFYAPELVQPKTVFGDQFDPLAFGADDMGQSMAGSDPALSMAMDSLWA